jgi:hypothetical protein
MLLPSDAQTKLKIPKKCIWKVKLILQYLVCRCFRDVNFLVVNLQNLKAGLMHLMESKFADQNRSDEHLFFKFIKLIFLRQLKAQ